MTCIRVAGVCGSGSCGALHRTATVWWWQQWCHSHHLERRENNERRRVPVRVWDKQRHLQTRGGGREWGQWAIRGVEVRIRVIYFRVILIQACNISGIICMQDMYSYTTITLCCTITYRCISHIHNSLCTQIIIVCHTCNFF